MQECKLSLDSQKVGLLKSTYSLWRCVADEFGKSEFGEGVVSVEPQSLSVVALCLGRLSQLLVGVA